MLIGVDDVIDISSRSSTRSHLLDGRSRRRHLVVLLFVTIRFLFVFSVLLFLETGRRTNVDGGGGGSGGVGAAAVSSAIFVV